MPTADQPPEQTPDKPAPPPLPSNPPHKPPHKPPPLAQQRLARKAEDRTSQTAPGRAKSTNASSVQVIADVAVGPNLRVKDNLFQALFILASIAIAAGIGAFVAPQDIGPGWGAAMGGIVGLIAGALISGGILMVYRLFRH